MTDIEDALKRLEKLANEEVRMVTAQGLKATHAVNDRVGVVESGVLNVEKKVAGVDERVAGVNDRVAAIDERVARVDDRVLGVGDRVACVDTGVAGVDDFVKAIDNKVAVVIDGAQPSLINQQENSFDSDVPRGKRDKSSHTTSRRRHGSSEKYVIFFLSWHAG